MKAIFRLIVTMLLLTGWGLAASAVHVVWTGDMPIITPKENLGVRDTYADISKWTADDVSNHPELADRLLVSGHADALARIFPSKNHDDLVSQIEDAIARGPTTKPATTTMAEKVESVATRVASKLHR